MSGVRYRILGVEADGAVSFVSIKLAMLFLVSAFWILHSAEAMRRDRRRTRTCGRWQADAQVSGRLSPA